MARQRRQTADTVETALDRFWIDRRVAGNVPDYSGFMSWIAEKEKEAKSESILPLHAMSARNPILALPQQLVKAAQSLGIEITRDGARPMPNLFGKLNGRKFTVKSFNQAKLLW